jgi:cysteinyl-tRNA synthetase
MGEAGRAVPPEIVDLLARREERRAAKDFEAADQIRDEIRALGYEIVDSPTGASVRPAPTEAPTADPGQAPRVRAANVASRLEEPPTHDFSVQWVVQGWPEDVLRGISSFRANQGDARVQHVVVDAADTDASMWPPDVELVALSEDAGWGADRNAGLRRASGPVVLVVDGSVEVTDDVLGPLARALAAPSVGIAGPFGISTTDMRSFEEAAGPDVDAIEGYLMAFRREILERGDFFDEKFRFYRTADIEFSFRVRSRGLAARVVDLPVVRHEHRMWHHTPPKERERLSKRNFYRFLDRWRERTDLIVGPGGG